jgi:membrane protease YdiL (CAAX protease family)
MSLVTELISSVLQLLVFAFLPFIVHLAGSKTAKGFLRDLGFHRAERRTWRLMWIALAAIFAIHPIHYLIPGVPEVMNSEASLNGKVRAAGFSFEMVLVVIVVSWIKTALAEEILFRGFLAKRLIRRWGFVAGNTVQAAVFGVVHGALLMLLSEHPIPLPALAAVVLFPGAAGYLLGWIKEKQGNGSILPGYVAHALGNNVTLLMVMFGWA